MGGRALERRRVPAALLVSRADVRAGARQQPHAVGPTTDGPAALPLPPRNGVLQHRHRPAAGDGNGAEAVSRRAAGARGAGPARRDPRGAAEHLALSVDARADPGARGAGPRRVSLLQNRRRLSRKPHRRGRWPERRAAGAPRRRGPDRPHAALRLAEGEEHRGPVVRVLHLRARLRQPARRRSGALVRPGPAAGAHRPALRRPRPPDDGGGEPLALAPQRADPRVGGAHGALRGERGELGGRVRGNARGPRLSRGVRPLHGRPRPSRPRRPRHLLRAPLRGPLARLRDVPHPPVGGGSRRPRGSRARGHRAA